MNNPANISKKYRLILSAVHMVYRLVNATFNLKELTLRLTRLICQFIRGSSASIYLLDPTHKHVVLIAIFNSKINIFIDKKKDLVDIPERERKVTQGASVFEKRMIGLPLVTDDHIGAIFVKREAREAPFTSFDQEMLSVFAEQAVTAIKNLQLHEEQEKTVLSSIQLVGALLEKYDHKKLSHAPTYLKITRAIAERLNISQDGVRSLEFASVLHDAGVIDVPYEILSKHSQLTPEEFKLIRSHPGKSVELIQPVEFLRPVLPIILYHHERYDGTGYPSGLKKEQIPLGARIMAVVDAFEAMVQPRPYRRAVSVTEAMEELKRNSGTQFDPKVVNVFCDLSRQKKFRNYLSLLKG